MKLNILILSVLLLASCSSMKHARVLDNIRHVPCNQENSYHYSKDDIPRPLAQIQLDSLLTANYAYKDLNIANAIGILDLLQSYLAQKNKTLQNNSIENRLELINIRQDLNYRIDLATLEISSVSAELDCEKERLDQIASYLSNREAKKETNLTIASIILGSVSAIATADLVFNKDESNASDYIGIGVGIADAAFGAILLTSNPKVSLTHKRNVLREIWFATETSSVYPPSIWYYLNYFNPQKTNSSMREQLISNWEKFGQVEKNTEDKSGRSIDIYFGDGGEYTIDEIVNRASMYEQIESIIKLMNQDLRNLTLSLGKIYSR